MLRSIGLGDPYFPTHISKSEVGVLAKFRVSTWKTTSDLTEQYFLLGNS